MTEPVHDYWDASYWDAEAAQFDDEPDHGLLDPTSGPPGSGCCCR